MTLKRKKIVQEGTEDIIEEIHHEEGEHQEEAGLITIIGGIMMIILIIHMTQIMTMTMIMMITGQEEEDIDHPADIRKGIVKSRRLLTKLKKLKS